MKQKYIFRASKAGVFYGELASQENTPAGTIVEIANCRRIWYWNGAASLSELAMTGPKKAGSKFPGDRPKMRDVPQGLRGQFVEALYQYFGKQYNGVA